MKAAIRFVQGAAVLGGLLALLPATSLADKGGKPNKNSVAVTAACKIDDTTIHAYSCKALSNVVLWCGSAWVKHDDIAGPDGEEINDGIFDCGVDADGNPLGAITMVAIKSGSQKNSKHHPEDYTPVEDAPSGSGLFLEGDLLSCDDPLFEAPSPGECDAGDNDDDGPILN